jgi:hypothetical protein
VIKPCIIGYGSSPSQRAWLIDLRERNWITSPRLATARFTDLPRTDLEALRVLRCEEPALRRPLCVVGLAPFIGAFFSLFPQEHNKVLQFRGHFLRRLKALPKLMPNDGL